MVHHPLTVLIVDDELPIREELREFPWEEYSAVLIGEAKNGLEALQLCRSYAPDLVVTDISMPVMDGLELVRALGKELPETRAVLLTCHGEFEYAREALRMGALDYILKVTMEEKHLAEAIGKARAAVEKEQTVRLLELYRGRAEQFRLMRQALAGETLPHAAARRPLRPVLLRVLGSEAERLFADLEVFAFLLAERFPGKEEDRIWPLRSGSFLLLLEADSELEEPNSALSALAARLNRMIGETLPFLGGRVYGVFVLGVGLSGEEQWDDLVRRLDSGADLHFYEPDARVYECPERSLGLPDPELVREIETEWRRAAGVRRGVAPFVRERLVPWLAANRCDPREWKRHVLGWRSEWQPDAGDVSYRRTTERILEAETLREMEAALVHEAERKDGSAGRGRIEVQRAKALIAERLQEELTVVSVAREVGLRDHYFSRLFREETGESFQDFVLRMRMEQAARLLQTTNLKVYEIAERVGIPNYRYFSVLFRRWTGTTPTDYKRG